LTIFLSQACGSLAEAHDAGRLDELSFHFSAQWLVETAIEIA